MLRWDMVFHVVPICLPWSFLVDLGGLAYGDCFAVDYVKRLQHMIVLIVHEVHQQTDKPELLREPGNLLGSSHVCSGSLKCLRQPVLIEITC